MCRLTSQSMHKDLFVRDLELMVNPDLQDTIEIEECIGCNISNKEDFDSDLCIEPGETYECLFKLKVNKVNLATSTIEDTSPKKDKKADSLQQPQD